MSHTIQEQLTKHEKEVLSAYPDSKGYLTIGVGRMIDSRLGGGISHSEAMVLLNNDIAATFYWLSVDCHPWWEGLDAVRQRVLIDMGFNLGRKRFGEFKKMLLALAAGDFAASAREMTNSQWAKDVKTRAVRLTAMMRTGQDYTD